MRSKLLALWVALWCGHALAATIEQPLADRAQEQMALSIIRELKCVVCEGQSLADSDAALAKQMRAHVRKLIAEGNSREDVVEFFRSRYGDQILLTPPLKSNTLLLWLAPLLLLLGGGTLVWRHTTHARAGNQ